MFFKGSRYATVETLDWTDSDERVIRFKATRFITTPAAVTAQTVCSADRLDLLAHHHFRDAERFWRICDANVAMWPDDLLRPVGRRIEIPASEG
ncbi:MAG: hypothetical protein JXB13_07005 [Phycisphaerae bacterium]|nr:hypothetical protein [Phycisphaerae bacterium]